MTAAREHSATPPGERVAVVAGLRTPFARQLTAFSDLNAIQLGTMVTTELLARLDLDPALVERFVYGQVGILPEAPNMAREVMLSAGLPPTTDAYSISRACATSFQTTADVAQAIRLGDIEIGMAGGADSTSVLPIQFSRKLSRAFIHSTRAKGVLAKLKLFRGIRPKDFAPRPPAVRDYTTNLGMGEIAEQMAKNHGISREAQDELALRSHQRAARAWEEGKLADEVMTAFVPPYDREPLQQDNNVRADSSMDALARLRPAFDRRHGTVTAANSTPLTDGASTLVLMKESRARALARLRPAFDRRHGTVTAANSTPLTDGASTLVLMKESRARALGYEPLGFIRSSAFAAIDPFNDALMGPSYATPIALDRAGLKLHDMTLVDMHEAFASQTLANINNWPSKRFAREVLGRDEPIGEIDWERFNVLGGSIAYGHPFAATGGRIIVQTLNELRRRGGGVALTTACAAGGLGAAMVLEVA